MAQARDEEEEGEEFFQVVPQDETMKESQAEVCVLSEEFEDT